MTRTAAYKFTVRMEDGQVHPEDSARLQELKEHVRSENSNKEFKRYVKLQGRLGKDNPNTWKYRQRRHGGIYGRAQCVRLEDAAYADVYVYVR